jgi:tetratricopeptide (TPR) repeat protein
MMIEQLNKHPMAQKALAVMAIVVVLSFFVYPAQASGLTDEQKLNAYYTLITMKINSGAYDDALENIEIAIPLAGDDSQLLADLWLKKGAVHAMQGNYEAALPALQSALEYDEGAADAHLLYAQIYAEQGDAAKAIEHLKQYLSLRPDDNSRYAMLAELNFSLGQYEEAEEAYSHYIDSQDAVDLAALYMRGVSYMQSGSYEEAIDDFTFVVDDPENGQNARFNRAISYMQLGRLDEAEKDFTVLIDAGLLMKGLRFNRGAVRMSQANMTGAVEDFTASIDGEEQTADALVNRATCHLQLQQFDEAYDDFTRYMALTGAKDTATYYRGITLLSMKKFDEAVKDFTVFLDDIVPQMPQETLADLPAWARNYRAAAHMGAARFEQALVDLTANIDEGSLKAISYYNRSLCYQGLGKNELAEEDLVMSLAEEEQPAVPVDASEPPK